MTPGSLTMIAQHLYGRILCSISTCNIFQIKREYATGNTRLSGIRAPRTTRHSNRRGWENTELGRFVDGLIKIGLDNVACSRLVSMKKIVPIGPRTRLPSRWRIAVEIPAQRAAV
jgi:hypothetical protein